MTAPRTLTFTVGAGLSNPQGRRIEIGAPEDLVLVVATSLRDLPAAEHSWWSGGTFAADYLEGVGWEGADGIGLDVDYYALPVIEQGMAKANHAALSDTARGALGRAVAEGRLPGSLAHSTPRGARIIFILSETVRDVAKWRLLALGAVALVHAFLREAGLAARMENGLPVEGLLVDVGASTDRARRWNAPRAVVDGVARTADVHVLRRDLYRAEDLEGPARAADSSMATGRANATRREESSAYLSAVAAYNLAHPHEWPRNGGTCPACGHEDCFGTLPRNPSRWSCFSDNHGRDSQYPGAPQGVGVKGSKAWTGDALDLDAHAAGVKPWDLLVREGYLPAAPRGVSKPRREDGPPQECEPVLVRASDVKPEAVRWLAYPYLPAGKPVLLAGDPDVGKTHLAIKVAADVTRGAAPFGGAADGATEPRPVVYVSAEDGIADTLRPRFEKAGADLSRVHFLTGKRAPGESREWSVTLCDLALLDRMLASLKPALVIVDPIQAYLGPDADMHRANDVRESLRIAAVLGEKHGTTFLLLAHLSKAPQGRAVYRTLGSIDFVAGVRSLLMVGLDPTDPEPDVNRKRRVVAHAKCNLARKGRSLTFTLDAEGVHWGPPSDLTAADLVAPDANPEKRREGDRAEAFLRSALAGGDRPADDVKGEARAAMISETTLRRAKESIPGFRVYRLATGAAKDGKPPPGEWWWGLPGRGGGGASRPQDAQDAQAEPMSTLGSDERLGGAEARDPAAGASGGDGAEGAHGAQDAQAQGMSTLGSQEEGASRAGHSCPPGVSDWDGWQEHACSACRARMLRERGEGAA
jgi:hypothetical protein